VFRRFWKWLLGVIGIESDAHTFEVVISLCEDDGILGGFRCTRCGYSVNLKGLDGPHPPCTPRAHEWAVCKVFQWEHVALSGKLAEPLQCGVCGAHALTEKDWERFGCPGPRTEP
jgi:hypothetical protein